MVWTEISDCLTVKKQEKKMKYAFVLVQESNKVCFVVLSNCIAVALVPTGLHLSLPVSAFAVLPLHFFVLFLSLTHCFSLSFHSKYIMN